VRDAQGQPRYSLIHLKLIDYLRTHMFATDDLIDVHAKIAAWCSRDLAHLWQPTTNLPNRNGAPTGKPTWSRIWQQRRSMTTSGVC
jgi:hypothetical protein